MGQNNFDLHHAYQTRNKLPIHSSRLDQEDIYGKEVSISHEEFTSAPYYPPSNLDYHNASRESLNHVQDDEDRIPMEKISRGDKWNAEKDGFQDYSIKKEKGWIRME
jgi:hypothetical protein